MSTREIHQNGGGTRRAFLAPVPAFADDLEESEDKLLTVAFKRGEKGAYQAIHDRYSTRVHGVCRRMLLHPEDAEEAAQESFLRVYQALGRFNGRYLLGPWITRITTNVCLDHLRARGRRPVDLMPVEVLDVHGHVDGELDPQEIHVRRSEGRRVHKLLESMPPLYRAAIVLRDFEGLSYAEIATALEITEPQTKALIHRARQAFKRSWSSALLALPLRFVNRFRRFETSVREQGNHASASVQHSGEAMGSAVHAVSSCSAMLQQCGQYLVDKGAAVATAAMVGVGVGAAAVPASPPPPARVISQQAPEMKTLDVTTGASALVSLRAPGPVAPDKEKATTTNVVEEPVPEPAVEPTPAAEEPVDEPAPEPTESAAPVDPGGSGGNPEPTPAESPSPTPSPLPPAGFTFAFDVSQPGSTTACSCAGPTQVHSSYVGLTSAGIERLDQVLTGTASAGGAPAFGLWVDHQSPAGTNHYMDFRMNTHEGAYHYTASGTVVDRVRMDWSGWEYTYRGTYRLTSRPGGSEPMTTSGTYTVVVRASWQENRVVSTEFALVDGS